MKGYLYENIRMSLMVGLNGRNCLRRDIKPHGPLHMLYIL